MILFAERGYRGTTMWHIGEAMGIRGDRVCITTWVQQQLLQDIMFSHHAEGAVGAVCGARGI